jgi:hypothetical protein
MFPLHAVDFIIWLLQYIVILLYKSFDKALFLFWTISILMK